MDVTHKSETFYQRFGKRALDLALAVPASIALAPVAAGVAASVATFLGRPVVFRQVRLGRGGRPFVVLKFRTMTDARDASGNLLPDAERLTSFGRFLRAASLDELPTLLNVVRGDISLVGPRPLLPEYRSLYSAYQWRRHEVPPGVTGWAQVNGRNKTDWPSRFAQDVWYVDNQSLALDLRILWKTVSVVLSREGIGQGESPTMPFFRGEQAPDAPAGAGPAGSAPAKVRSVQP